MTALIHSGQTIVITGASKGIGAEMALKFGKLGARVVMLARDMEALNKIATQIKESGSGGEGIVFQVDLAKINEMEDTVKKIIQHVGVPDVLINNAGAGKWATIRETSANDIVQDIAVPGTSTMVMTKLLLDKMIEKGTLESPVHIINITSPAGLGMQVPGTGAYSVARSMVTNFTQLLRIDLRRLEDRVKISLIAPGKVSTDYFKLNRGEDRVPMQWCVRELTPGQVADKVSQVVANRKSVDLIFPFSMKALIMAFNMSPTIMQCFLTHAFGWQPSKKEV